MSAQKVALWRAQQARREHLRRYVTEALKDSVFSPADLLEPAVTIGKLRGIITEDLKAIGGDFARDTVGKLLGAVFGRK